MQKLGLRSQHCYAGIMQPCLSESGWQSGVVDAKRGVQQLILEVCLRTLRNSDPSLSLDVFV